MILTGSYNDKSNLNKVTEFMVNNSKNEQGKYLANHIWVNKINDPNILTLVDSIRTSNEIIDTFKKQFPKYKIKNVTESDEIYFAVSPKDANGSDRSLVDCHYDAPFSILPNFNILFYRIILACNENNHVTTIFPNDDVKVKMNTGDFHGLDYNKDYHCVDGQIPPNKNRVLLKLHYLLVPEENSSDLAEKFVRFSNTKWTSLSRDFMRMSSHPNNIFEYMAGSLVNISRFAFNNMYILLFIIILLCIYFYKPFNTYITKKFKSIISNLPHGNYNHYYQQWM